MHAWLCENPVGVDALTWKEIPTPSPQRGEVLIEIEAASLNFPDALIVHRLDMGTSGIVVMARGADALRELSAQFEQRRVRKRYQALVDGAWSAAMEGEIDLPMTVKGPKQRVDHADGRPSLTRYRVLEVDATRGVSRIELDPVTGRSHQLRVHLEAMGHPIIGDDFYGTPASCASNIC